MIDSRSDKLMDDSEEVKIPYDTWVKDTYACHVFIFEPGKKETLVPMSQVLDWDEINKTITIPEGLAYQLDLI